MTRRLVALLLFVAAGVVFVAVVWPAHRQQGAAQAEYGAARTERERLRVRLADLGRRTSEEEGATATDGATAVRALRQASLAATLGLPVSGVELSTSPVPQGAIAAQGRFVAHADFVVALRLARRLASPSSGLLLSRVTLAEAREGVRVEAETFILREGA